MTIWRYYDHMPLTKYIINNDKNNDDGEVIQLNLFILCVSENPYFTVKVHSQRSQSNFLTTTPHIHLSTYGADICQHKAIICKLGANIC